MYKRNKFPSTKWDEIKSIQHIDKLVINTNLSMA